jgi:hypothetical protein
LGPPKLDAAVMVKVNVPVVAGMPAMTPVELFRVKPFGNDPPVIVKLYVPVGAPETV